jgi:chemotaxis signal transduction protein
MNLAHAEIDARIVAERQSFDRSFAMPPPAPSEERVRLLVLRAGKDRFAVRLSEIAGLHQDRRIVPLASDAPGLIGMAGIRAAVVPVFSLARVLGAPDSGEPPRWLTVCNGAQPIALAFSGFEGHREIGASALHASGMAEGRTHVREVARCDDGVVPVISIASIVAAISGATRPVES